MTGLGSISTFSSLLSGCVTLSVDKAFRSLIFASFDSSRKTFLIVLVSSSRQVQNTAEIYPCRLSVKGTLMQPRDLAPP